MKNLSNILFIVLALCLLTPSDTFGQNNEKCISLFELKWSVSSSKDAYIPSEPIQINFLLTNQTNKNTLKEESFTTTVEIAHNGKINRNPQLSGITERRISVFEGVKSGESVERTQLLDFNLSRLFPEYGTYTLKFYIQSQTVEGEGLEFSTAPFTIVIKKPEGIDEEAYDYILKNYSANPVQLFSFVDYDKGIKFLADFVDKYSASVYGDYAVFKLGSLYFSDKQYAPAKEMFDRLKLKEDFILRQEVNNYLYSTDIKLRQIKENQ